MYLLYHSMGISGSKEKRDAENMAYERRKAENVAYERRKAENMEIKEKSRKLAKNCVNFAAEIYDGDKENLRCF